MIYIVTEISRKNGIGHFKRMLALSSELKEETFFVLYQDYDYILPGVLQYQSFAAVSDINRFIDSLPECKVIVDMRKIPSSLLDVLQKKKAVYYDVQKINMKQGLVINPIDYQSPKTLFPDLYFYSGLPYFITKRTIPDTLHVRSNMVLITFGGSDPFFLTEKIIKMLDSSLQSGQKQFAEWQFHIIHPRASQSSVKENIHIYPLQENLDAFINKADIVITAFGSTMLEGLSLQKKIILINPTKYHQLLSQKQGFVQQSYYKTQITQQKLYKALLHCRGPEGIRFLNQTADLITRYYQKTEKKSVPQECPVCRSKNRFLILNELDRQVYRCRKCSTNQLVRKKIKIENIYKNQYFLKEYKEQYGKTYLEDRENIERLGGRRIRIITKLHHGPGRIFDIGAAYGFFLNAARRLNWTAEGIELIPDAVRYAHDVLKLDVRQESFEQADLKQYDAVTLWFVFEHLQHPVQAFERLALSLNPGGILAVGVPNSAGLTSRFNQRQWLKDRPDDHFFDFSVRSFKTLAEKNSLKIVKIVNQGIYYKRVQKILPFLPDWKILHLFFRLISRIWNLGDTIEVYFKKVSV